MKYENVVRLAKEFLDVADELQEKVSNYINGSNGEEDVMAYNVVRKADRAFVKAYNAYWGENHEEGLNYDLATSVVD